MVMMAEMIKRQYNIIYVGLLWYACVYFGIFCDILWYVLVYATRFFQPDLPKLTMSVGAAAAGACAGA